MDNLDDSENNAKISDSGYSNSCSNSQFRHSRSSKSTHSGSHSSGSSGYGEGKTSTSGYSPKSSGLATQLEKRSKKVNSDPIVIDAAGESKTCTTIFEAPAEELIQVCPASDKECVKTLPPVEVMDISTSERNNTTNEGIMTFNNVSATPNQIQNQQNCAPVQKAVTSDSSVGFSCVMSMHDGIVMYTTSTITTSLGFPRDMWIGRSFIDFIDPKDRDTFASQITNLADPKTTKKALPDNSCVSSMVSRIRRYRGIAAGYGVKEVKVSYMPFKLKLSFKSVDDEEGKVFYLVIQATPIFSAFKIPNEPFTKAAPFIIRHSANGNLEYLDPDSVPFLGYLPQDMLNKDVLRLYHHEDLPYLTEVYKTIVKEGGMPRSKSYRIQAQNGDYVRVQTEWLSFINAWSRKLEFVIGKHLIVEGPTNFDVFETPDPDKGNFLCAEEEKEVQAERDQLVKIMTKVLTKPAKMAKELMTKRCQGLATVMESLMDDSPKPNEELKLDIQDADQSCFERDSVMLGGLSPHREYNDSKSRTGTPLSYNQLNYNENLQRYFESHRSNVVDVAQLESTPTKNEIVPGPSNWMVKPTQESAETNSVENASSSNDSSFLTLSICSQKQPSPEFRPLRLTESIMSKHNTKMEKELFKKHREQRSIKGDRSKSKDKYQKKNERLARCSAPYQSTSALLPFAPEPQTHQGLKRTQKMNVNMIAPKQLCTSLNQPRRCCISVSPVPPPMNSMQGVMYGQAVYGQPFLYSSMSHPIQNLQPIASSSTSKFNTMNTLGLGNSNYEEACKATLPARSTTSNKNFWINQKRPDAGFKSGQGDSTSNSSNHTGRRSNGALSCARNFNEKTDGNSSYSSFYSSFFKTDSGSADDSEPKKTSPNDNKAKLDSTHGYFESHVGKKVHKRKMDPPWLEQVCVTPNLMYKYQMKNKSIDEILKADKQKIQKLAQPSLVNEQLGQLYMDLQLEGVASRLTLEEGITSSSSSGEETPAKIPKKVRTKREHSKLVMIYEEDAPLPSPPEFKEPSPGPSMP